MAWGFCFIPDLSPVKILIPQNPGAIPYEELLLLPKVIASASFEPGLALHSIIMTVWDL